jgi:hypothetical protein
MHHTIIARGAELPEPLKGIKTIVARSAATVTLSGTLLRGNWIDGTENA